VNVLAIGAHPDDIELGCGATLASHRRRGDAIWLLVMTTGERGPQAARSRISEQEDAAALLGAQLRWGGFSDGAVPEGRPAVDAIQDVVIEAGAGVVYTHSPQDSHQDHRATAVASLSACRRLSRVLMYESPTSQDFAPDLYVDAADMVEVKADLVRAHVSQVLKNGLVDIEALEALARYRGFQARIRHAEAFEADRFVWDLAPARAPAIPLDLSELALATEGAA
jgi:LmbE family N-acetylglucosaminyl deacetylase